MDVRVWFVSGPDHGIGDIVKLNQTLLGSLMGNLDQQSDI